MIHLLLSMPTCTGTIDANTPIWAQCIKRQFIQVLAFYQRNSETEVFMFSWITCRAKVSDEANGEYGWIHIRQSVHNPNIALNMQSSVPGGCQAMARILHEKYACSCLINSDESVSVLSSF